MPILIANCFDWIGYHLVNEFLDAGYDVDGVGEITSTKKETLSMFIGRNALFNHISLEKIETKESYRMAIISPDAEPPKHLAADNICLLTYAKKGKNVRLRDGICRITLPLLFGEWMPMTDKGMYCNGTFIPFDSDKFAHEAVYIGDFTKCIFQWMKTGKIPPHMEVISANHQQRMEKKYGSVYIQNQGQMMQTQLKKVIKHYQQVGKK